MTLDSRDKRAAALQYLQPWLFTPPLPDATLSAIDREQLGHLYRGIPLLVPGGLTSRERRASGLELMQTGVFLPPLPDATIASGDRRQLRGLYNRTSGSGVSGVTIWDDGDTTWDDGATRWDQPTFLTTRDRRASALDFLQIGHRALPLADATIGSSDRASLANLYRGITLQTSGINHLDTRNKRAAVLQFLQTGVTVLPLPDGTISAIDREQVSRLYPGIAAISVVPIYAGSGAGMRTGSLITADPTASSGAVAGNTAAFMQSLCVLIASGNYSSTLNPIGSGQAVSNSVTTGTGAYLGDVNGTGDTMLSASRLTGSGTFLAFAGLSSGTAFVLNTCLMNGVGSYSQGTNELVDAIQAIAVELGPERLVTFIEAMRAMAAVLCGETSGTPTQAGNMGYRAIGNPAVVRLAGEEDNRGTRESVVLTLDP